MRLKQYQVDAFAERVFEGNPAAVCPLEAWPHDGLLQAIAEENNLSETAFFVADKGGFELRWFTPVAEVDLCGHATLATAHVIFEMLNYSKPVVSFQTRSGELTVKRKENRLEMNFPAVVPTSTVLWSSPTGHPAKHIAQIRWASDRPASYAGGVSCSTRCTLSHPLQHLPLSGRRSPSTIRV